jgi:hypothetical protein
MLAGAYASWLDSVSACCNPCASERKPARHESHPELDSRRELLARQVREKDFVVLKDQPGLTPPLSFEPVAQDVRTYDRRERAPRKSFGSLSSRSFSVRRRFTSNASSTRRPQISAPTNFRHLNSDSFHFPQQDYGHITSARQRRTSFRPIELSIYMPGNALSPITSHFESDHPDIPMPAPAHMHASSFDSDGVTLAHERSYSSMSFHLPRRPVPDMSSTSSLQGSPPTIPPRSRLRANTSPDVERMLERIASAMIEKERLQAEIDSVVERQSIYMSSRPSTAYGLEGETFALHSTRWESGYSSLPDLEPMPAIPALPAAAPSFAERLSTDRPQTAPPTANDVAAMRAESRFGTPPPQRHATPPSKSGARINGRPVDIPLAPPLPLVLRPPLRKKKSFSRVSNWLFPGGEAQHQRDFSQGSITNQPQPLTGHDGFYQCFGVVEGPGTDDSASTVSTWTTTEEDRTMPTSTWSPGSSPVTKMDTPTPTADRRATFGRNGAGHRPQSVGVAF